MLSGVHHVFLLDVMDACWCFEKQLKQKGLAVVLGSTPKPKPREAQKMTQQPQSQDRARYP